MYQWFAEMVTANMISWRQGGFSCGSAEKQLKTQMQKNALIGCVDDMDTVVQAIVSLV